MIEVIILVLAFVLGFLSLYLEENKYAYMGLLLLFFDLIIFIFYGVI
jgi:hypothetical protein